MITGDEIPDEVIATFNFVFGLMAEAIAYAGREARAAATPFTVVGLILVDSPGVMEDGEYWPDAHEVTFTDPDPVPEPARDRLQDWLERSGAVLDSTAALHTDEPPPWPAARYAREINQGSWQRTVRLDADGEPLEEDR